MNVNLIKAIGLDNPKESCFIDDSVNTLSFPG
jgi:hypothetical protein